MDRRTFHRLCGGLIAGAGALHRELAAAAPPGDAAGPWPRTRLLDADDAPLTLASLAPGESLVFHYPYRVTPCFLVRLDPADAAPSGAAPSGTDAAGGRDVADGGGPWPGGLGDDGSLVAFSAICSHKMSHPARPISHIAYRAEPVEFTGPDGARHTRSGMISCCSERSVYDPADGARVLAGPAPVPLAAIELAVDGDGTIAAVASLGRDRYADFLDAFGFRLALEHGSSDVRRMSGDTAVAVPAERFSRQQIRC